MPVEKYLYVIFFFTHDDIFFFLFLADKVSTSKDLFHINIELLKSVLLFIIDPLTECIYHCLSSRVFPQSLKTSNNYSIIKEGDQSKLENYISISVLHVFVFRKLLKLL